MWDILNEDLYVCVCQPDTYSRPPPPRCSRNLVQADSYLKSLTSFLLTNPTLDVSWLGSDEEVSERWPRLTQLIRKALIGKYRDESAGGRQKRKEKKDELKVTSLRLISALANLLQEKVGKVMADPQDESSFLNILVTFLQKRFASGTQQGKHSAFAHCEALKTLTWILFYTHHPEQTIEFLTLSMHHFTQSEDDGDQNVMAAAMYCWSFLLAMLPDKAIQECFTHEYVKLFLLNQV